VCFTYVDQAIGQQKVDMFKTASQVFTEMTKTDHFRNRLTAQSN